MRKTRRSRGRNDELYVINVMPTAEHPADFHNGEELALEQRENFRTLLYDDSPKSPQSLDSSHISRQWDHPIETTGSIKRQCLSIMSPAERAELSRQLKDEVEARLIRPSHSEFGSPILVVRKAYGSLRLDIDYHGLNEVIRKDAYPLPRVDNTLDELKDENIYTPLNLASGF
jgi:hypothetical protein